MDSPFKAQVGAVLSADIAVPEHERELRFYSRVLRTGEAPRWREDLMSNIGVPVIGLGPMSAEYSNLPLQWMPHIQVADVAGSVRRALDSGAREVMHAKAPDGTSQWAVLLDPNGAAFGLVAVVPEEYVPVVPTEVNRDGMGIGRIAWLDLVVSDAAATRDFYMNVVGWSYREVAMDDDEGTYADYVMLAEDGSPVAIICHRRGINAKLPPVWLIYLPVDDLRESLLEVEKEGGAVVQTATVNSGTDQYQYAVIQDPVGVYVALLQD